MQEIGPSKETLWQRVFARAFAVALVLFLLVGLGLLLLPVS